MVILSRILGGPKKGRWGGSGVVAVVVRRFRILIILSPLTADTARELDILGHNGDALGVNGAQIGIFKETN